MKHIKTYKIFESRFDDFKNIIDNLYDYSLEFSDDGLPVQIMPNNDIGMKMRSLNIPTSDVEPFFMRIYSDLPNKHHKKLINFKFQQYIPTMLSIINYMKSEGYDTNIELDELYFQPKNPEASLIGRSSLFITSDNFIKAIDNGGSIPDISTSGKLRVRLNKDSLILLNSIEKVNNIKLTFDKINKNYDI
jgi:hypothetical protein